MNDPAAGAAHGATIDDEDIEVRPVWISRRIALPLLGVALVLLGLGVLVALLRGDSGPEIAAEATTPLNIPPLLEPTRVDGTEKYELSIGEATHDYGDGRVTPSLSYNGASMFGPTMVWRAGAYVEIDVSNTTPDVTTTHWHGADVPADDDGGPHSGIQPDTTWTADFPVIQPAATLWYHPHLMGTTGSSVALGAVGLVIVEDQNPHTQNLPSTYGIDDIPVILQNPDLDEDGVIQIDDEDDGDETTVNGTFDPFVDVPEGLVRLRILNASQKTIYEISSDRDGLLVIASDGGYLNRPVRVRDLTVTPGDRVEVILDTRDGIVNLVDDDYGKLLELRPDESLPAVQEMPEQLNEIVAFDPDDVDRERIFHMDRVDGDWVINDAQMNMQRIDQSVRFDDVERWIISSSEGVHAFHVHQTQFQIVAINGEPPPEEETGWEDTVFVSEARTVEVVARFNSYTNPDVPYMFHCHVMPHEERGMMGQFQVLGDGPADA
ncbi:MAG: multicopper oxidase domain-containing protein [Actinomycetota bacterium]